MTQWKIPKCMKNKGCESFSFPQGGVYAIALKYFVVTSEFLSFFFPSIASLRTEPEGPLSLSISREEALTLYGF